MSGIGSAMIRRDARVRATGTVRYTEDITLPGMLYAVLVRSPIAFGRIRAIDTTAAEQAEGVRVLTAADVPDRCYGNYVQDQPILASTVVRFVGDPVAIVAATSSATARAAAALVKIEYDPLPAVLDLATATKVLESAGISRGDVETVFRDAHTVVTTRIESHRVHQGYLEPRAVTVAPAGTGLEIIMSTQQPFGVRSAIAELFDLPVSAVEVRVPAVGGGFGGKLHLGFAPQATAMALATGRPVQLVCERTEDMQTGSPRENSVVELSSAVDADGTIRARRCSLLLDAGAYALDTPILTSMAAFYATGPYAIESLEVKAQAVYTNTCPTGSFRGPTGPQMVYAVETHLNDIAAELSLDPSEIRRRNFIQRGDRGPTGELMVTDTAAQQCLDTVLERLEHFRAEGGSTPTDPRPRGYGFACAWWSTLGTPSAATVELHEDGSATLISGGTEIGTGAISTALPAIVAAELGIEAEAVTLNTGSTRDTPFDSGSRGSRTMFAAGHAARRAAKEVVRQVKEEAAELLEVSPDDLELVGGRVCVAGAPAASLALADVVASARMRSGPVVASGRYRAAPAGIEGSTLDNLRFARLGEPTFHCHGAEIALDRDTGRIEVLRYVAAHDTGPVLNPVGARSQVEGGVVQGIGYALTEHLETDDTGAVRNGNFHDYRMPTIADVPRSIETILIESHEATDGPFGAKGLGEPPVILPAAAIGAAVRDILGQQPSRLPLDAPSVAAFIDQTGFRAVRARAPRRSRPGVG